MQLAAVSSWLTYTSPAGERWSGRAIPAICDTGLIGAHGSCDSNWEQRKELPDQYVLDVKDEVVEGVLDPVKLPADSVPIVVVATEEDAFASLGVPMPNRPRPDERSPRWP
jgi:hypothetical protein